MQIIKLHVINIYSHFSNKNWHKENIKRWNQVFTKEILSKKSLNTGLLIQIIQSFYCVEELSTISSPTTFFQLLTPILDILNTNKD